MNRRRWILLTLAGGCGLGWTAKQYQYYFRAKRFAVIEPGALYRGGWQMSGPLRRIIECYRIRTVLNLACDPAEQDALGEGPIVRSYGIGWHKILMPGTGRGTFAQLDEAADVLADPERRPVFFHCAGGEHRTNMALAALRLKHGGWPLERALQEIARYGYEPNKNWRQTEHLRGYVAHLAGAAEGARID